ncbi:MAG TPA: ATP-binding protein [Holophagaceae bacterium]|nr:ATP-binding protein [Holophagaceae bacterium]
MDEQRRPSELTRLYVAVGLVVLIVMIVLAYKVTGQRVASGGIDAPTRWVLIPLGLANVLAIGTLLFIVARSMAKLYFERRSGILGARLRTRLVLALFAVSLLPSLMLFLVGRNFINKNVDRWFSPETEEVLANGKRAADAARASWQARLDFGAGRIKASASDDPEVLRDESDLDLVACLDVRGQGAFQVRNLDMASQASPPTFEGIAQKPAETQEGGGGLWLLAAVPRGDGRWVGGIFVPRDQLGAVQTLERRFRESQQLRAARDTLETLPQSTFAFLTMLALFLALWIGLTIARTITDPVRALAKAAQRVGAGDLQVQLAVSGEDELALLSRSFNTMTQDLRTGREALVEQTERLERQRAYLDQLLAALPVGVLSWRADGELASLNAAARKLLGMESVPLGPGTWKEVQEAPGLGRLPELYARVRASERALQEELRLGGEGEGRPVRAVVEPLAGGGVLAVLEDLSMLAQAEKRAAWQEVARRMAHEVKNPLTPIQLTAQRLLRRGREGRLDTFSVQEGAETILAEVQSLSRLVDSFTRFARLPQPQFAPCEAGELLRQVAALYLHNHPGVQWEVEQPAGPLSAQWDPDMVKRALINLVDNALGAMVTLDGAQGRIVLRLRREGDRCSFEVEDDGPGVPEEARGRLFEPYFSTKRKGTGLGLAITRRIAEDHGGEVSYEPLAKGSRFRLVLPVNPEG